MVTPDHFAHLEEPRRPLVDQAGVKAKFHALTTEHHPDVSAANSPDFAAVNIAFNTLREPRLRLRHLLELEAPELLRRNAPAPATVANLFLKMGAMTQTLDRFLAKRAGTKSTLGKATLIAEQLVLQEDLEEWLSVLEKEKASWLAKIPEMDAAWMRDRRAAFEPVAETAQALSYLDKWSAQIREGLVKLQIGE